MARESSIHGVSTAGLGWIRRYQEYTGAYGVHQWSLGEVLNCGVVSQATCRCARKRGFSARLVF